MDVKTISVTHVDFVKKKIGSFAKTSEGYLKGSGAIAKVGVLKYTLTDGTTINELVPEETLFEPQSLETVHLKPITNMHPQEKRVDCNNAKEKKIGWVGEQTKKIDSYLVANMLITDADAINAVNLGRQELSPGYTCDLVMQPGEYNGVKYDAVQTNRRYNHVAMCDRARGGDDLRINLDSEFDGYETNVNDKIFNRKETFIMALFKIDGVDYEICPQAVNFITKLEENLKSKVDECDKTAALLDAAKQKITDLEKRDTTAEIATGVKNRIALLNSAAKILDKEQFSKTDSMSDSEIKKMVILKKSPAADLKEKSEVYINARYDAIEEELSFNTNAIGSQREAATPKNDGSLPVDIVEKSRLDAEDRIKTAYKNLK